MVLRVLAPEATSPRGPGGAGTQSIVGFFEFCAHPCPALPHNTLGDATFVCGLHIHTRVRGDKERRVRISKHYGRRLENDTDTHMYILCPVGIIFIQADLFHHMICRCSGRKFRKYLYRLCLAPQPSSARNAGECRLHRVGEAGEGEPGPVRQSLLQGGKVERRDFYGNYKVCSVGPT